MTSISHSSAVTIQKGWRAFLKSRALAFALHQQRTNNAIVIYGPEWGAYPSDSEFMDDSDEEYYEEMESTPLVPYGVTAPPIDQPKYSDIVNSFIDKYNAQPLEWRDTETGKLLGHVFEATENNLQHTISCVSSDEEDDEEYDQGDYDEEMNERLHSGYGY
jgi:hypothetical protein